LGGSLFASIRCVYSTFTLAIPTTFRSLIIRTTIRTTRTRSERLVFMGVRYFAKLYAQLEICQGLKCCLDLVV
jgi:hypothetical protein